MHALLLLLALATQAQDSVLTAVFLNVGQGDAIVLRTPGRRVALIDAGQSGPRVIQELREMGVDTIDLVVASHPHADHIGGLVEVLRQFPVRYYMDNGDPYTTATYRNVMRTVEARAIAYRAAETRTITLDSVRLRVLPPAPDGKSLNDRSVGLLVEYGAFRILLTGDAESAALAHFQRLDLPTISVLKAAHHGSRNGVTPGFLQATRPRAVVISVGARNGYGHPDPWALRYYSAGGRAVFRTDQDGAVAVVARSDGSFRVITQTGREQDFGTGAAPKKE